MNNAKKRGITSSILIISGFICFATGGILFFLKTGMWFCFTRKFLNQCHVISGMVMGFAVLYHLYLNRKLYKTEMNTLFKREQKDDK